MEVKAFTYHSNGNLSTSKDYAFSSGEVTTSYPSYDNFGNPTKTAIGFFDPITFSYINKSFEENIYDNKEGGLLIPIIGKI